MAASAARLNDWLRLESETWASVRDSAMTTEALEARFAETDRAARAHLDAGRADVEKIVSGMEDILRAGHAVNVDGLIGDLLRLEYKTIPKETRSVEQSAHESIKLAGKKAPHLLRVLNDHLNSFQTLQHGWAAMFRDMRWRLMEARARYQPGKPAGPIVGEDTDLDEYLKSVS